jgi:serine/threonine-protein kinase
VYFVMPEHLREFTLSRSRALQFATVLVLVALWRICRGPPRPLWVLAAIDLGGPILVNGLAALAVATVPPGVHVEAAGAVVLILYGTLRAALVPSPPPWTALVVAAGALVVPFGTWHAAVREPSSPMFPHAMPVVAVSLWCAGGVAAAFVVSHVVHGLRREVKTAMRLGQYTLEEEIGRGGMGVVYRARHALLRRPTAIKLLAPGQSAVAEKRFEREVQITSMLTHPNTVVVYDFGHTRDGVFYYVMELLDGVSLQDLIEEQGPQPPGRVVHIMAQIASALAEAHGAGLIHRDVKPSNIILCDRAGDPDFVKVLDFGLVKETGNRNPALTGSAALTGTPLYMAPESILRPEAVDARVDIYALGAVGYTLVTGKPPFDGANVVEVCSHHLHTAPEPPSRRLGRPVPAALEEILLGCLAKSPEDRPQTGKALAETLRRLGRMPELSWEAVGQSGPSASASSLAE